jgi:hypothetical protein
MSQCGWGDHNRGRRRAPLRRLKKMADLEGREAEAAKRLRSAVHVDNLPLELTDALFEDLFCLCGPLQRAVVKRPEGFAPRSKTGLLVFEYAESAELAVAHLAGLEVMAHSVTLDLIGNPKDLAARNRESQMHQLDDVSRIFVSCFVFRA